MRDRARSYQLPLSLEAIWADLRVAKLLEDLRVSRRGGEVSAGVWAGRVWECRVGWRSKPGLAFSLCTAHLGEEVGQAVRVALDPEGEAARGVGEQQMVQPSRSPRQDGGEVLLPEDYTLT